MCGLGFFVFVGFIVVPLPQSGHEGVRVYAEALERCVLLIEEKQQFSGQLRNCKAADPNLRT